MIDRRGVFKGRDWLKGGKCRQTGIKGECITQAKQPRDSHVLWSGRGEIAGL
jgi:hypothetical protein